MNNEKLNKDSEGEVINVTKGFFNKIYKSVTNFEQYPELAAQGTGTALKYILKLVLCFSIIVLIGVMFEFRIELNSLVNKFDQNVPELNYSNGDLDVKSDDVISFNDEVLGKIIIDTKTEDLSKIEEYKKMDSDNNTRIIFLKNKVIIMASENREMSYEYKELINRIPNNSFNTFNKSDILNYMDSEGKYIIYISYALIMFISLFLIYFVPIILDALSVALLGYLTAIFAGLKIRFVAMFNMGIYALTLSILLNIIYTVVRIFTDFEIKYFEVAYIAIAYIYMAAAIFLLKANFMKKQAELIKIIEEQDKVKIEIEERERKKEEERKDKEREKEKKEKENKKNDKDEGSSDKEKNKDNNLNDSPEGSKA